MHWLLVVGLPSLVLGSWLLRKWQFRRILPLPPGPKGYPIIGNLLDLPDIEPWKTFGEWSKIYGNVVYLDLPLRPTVILGSANAALDLLDKRSDIYSDRNVNPMVELTGWDFNFALMPYSQRWRVHRKSFHEYFNERASRQWEPIQIEESRMFLLRLLDDPEGIEEHTRLVLSAIILRVCYGLRITSPNDEYVRIVREAMRGLSIISIPGTCWIDYFPVLRQLPDWFPGAQWKRTAVDIRRWVDAMKQDPIKPVLDDQNPQSTEHSVAAASFANLEEKGLDLEQQKAEREIIINVAGISYAAGGDTTNAAVQYFFAAMTIYPNVQKTAQAELDTVVGPDRLPDFDDRDKLVYVQAVALESLRWQVAVPYGVAHRLMQDDEYNGYLIPAGADIIPNAWAMLHDPEDYPDPFEFKPERFIKDGKIDPSVRDPSTIAFGFGRRICPGQHLAEATLFIIIASALHAFHIEPKEGERFDPDTMNVTGLISGPTKLSCILKPRSKKVERLIRASSVSG
ncbi:cytochrome P450 [Panus rudis PR-1116 ss-1]|nr:cytochrome P450 [Panus rudis PR-1116 ss-1]